MKKSIKSLVCVAVGLLSILGTRALNADIYLPYEGDRPGPLHCGEWRLSLKGGIDPTFFSDRTPSKLILGANFLLIPPGAYELDRSPKFSQLFNTPWQIGFEIGCAVDYNNEVYLEFAYERARGKSLHFNRFLSSLANLLIQESFSSYKAYSGYVGWRYHFSNVFWAGHFFFGLKAGMIERRSVDVHFVVGPLGLLLPIAADLGTDHYFNRRNVVSAGAHFGYNYAFGCGWSISLMAEVVTSGDMKNSQGIRFQRVPLILSGLSQYIAGKTGTVVEWPVTLSLTKSF